jgi:DNA polymerase phi
MRDLIETYKRMTSSSDTAITTSDDVSVKDASAEPMTMLADLLIAIMATPTSHSVRGLRETAKKAWSAICSVNTMTSTALECLLSTVCAEEIAIDNEENDGNDSDNSDNIDSDDDDNSTVKTAKKGNKSSSNHPKNQAPPPQKVLQDSDDSNDDSDNDDTHDHSNHSNNSSSNSKHKHTNSTNLNGTFAAAGGSDNDSSDDDEQMIDSAGLESLLAGDNSDDDGSTAGEFQHHEGADAALAAMLALKRTTRKAGAAAIERQQAQLRLRALDLIEVYCSRQRDSPLLATMLLPVYRAVKKLNAGQGTKTSEGRALSERLQSLFKNQVCKAKLKSDAVAAVSFDAAAAFVYFLHECKKAGATGMTVLANEGLYAVGRLIQSTASSSTTNSDALALAGTALGESLQSYLNKDRSSALNGKLFTECIKRFPTVAPALVPVLVTGTASAKTEYLKTEAFRLLTEVLSKRNAMDDAARSSLSSHSAAVLEALTALITASTTNDSGDATATATATERKASKSTMHKAKRLKPVLQCCSAVVKAEQQSNSVNLKKFNFEVLLQALTAVSDNSSSVGLSNICDNLQTRISELQDSITASTSTTSAKRTAATPVAAMNGKASKKQKTAAVTPAAVTAGTDVSETGAAVTPGVVTATKKDKKSGVKRKNTASNSSSVSEIGTANAVVADVAGDDSGVATDTAAGTSSTTSSKSSTVKKAKKAVPKTAAKAVETPAIKKKKTALSE